MGFRVAESNAVYGTGCGAESEARRSASTAEGSTSRANATSDLTALRLSGPIPESTEELAREIQSLARRISRATHRMLELIAAFDRRGGWKAGGHRSCAHWLHVETGLSLGAAREKVRTARALTAMPQTSQAMKQGKLPYSKVRALSRAAEDVADPQAEARLVARAKRQTTAQVEQMIRGFKHLGGRVEEAELERRRHAARYLSIRPDGNGMYQLRGTLPAEVGALLMRAVEAAGDALFREEGAARSQKEGAAGSREEAAAGSREERAGGSREEAPEGSRPNQPKLTPSQRRADAMGLLAERALAAGFGGGGADHDGGVAGGPEGLEDGALVAGRREGIADPDGGVADRDEAVADPDTAAGGGASCCACDAPPLSGTRAERYQVFLHVDPGTLQAEGEIGRSHLEDGTRVSAETSRRLTCDAGVVQVTAGADGSVLDVGRRTRTIPPAVRRALQVRDGGCRFPGCGLRFTEAHHLVHWADGGETTLDNLVLLCRFHHRRVHEDGFGVRRGPDGGVRFVDPKGRAIGWERRTVGEDGRTGAGSGGADDRSRTGGR
jgi:hypothetical protein